MVISMCRILNQKLIAIKIDIGITEICAEPSKYSHEILIMDYFHIMK
jgi:hypothetical protein